MCSLAPLLCVLSTFVPFLLYVVVTSAIFVLVVCCVFLKLVLCGPLAVSSLCVSFVALAFDTT